MKIQCDVCERAPATVICCADEAALCGKCDVEVHAANKLASKHQRLLLLHSLSNNLPTCDICQDKAAFIFCVEDRALFCQDCDEAIHSANSLAANHQRLLATGIKVAMSYGCNKNNPKPHQHQPEAPPKPDPSWSVDDLLHFSDLQSSDKKETLELGELEWLADVGLLRDEAPQAAEVPQLAVPQSSNIVNVASYRPTKTFKKPRIEMPIDDDEFFIVPDLG